LTASQTRTSGGKSSVIKLHDRTGNNKMQRSTDCVPHRRQAVKAQSLVRYKCDAVHLPRAITNNLTAITTVHHRFTIRCIPY